MKDDTLPCEGSALTMQKITFRFTENHHLFVYFHKQLSGNTLQQHGKFHEFPHFLLRILLQAILRGQKDGEFSNVIGRTVAPPHFHEKRLHRQQEHLAKTQSEDNLKAMSNALAAFRKPILSDCIW